MELPVTVKKMILAIGVSSVFIIAAGAAYYRSFSVLPFAFGVLLMSALNAVTVIMLKRALALSLCMEGKAAGKFVQNYNLLWYLLIGLVLVLAAKVPFIDLWGAVAGVFTMPVALFSMNFFNNSDEKAGVA